MEPSLERMENKIDKVLDKLTEHGELLARHGAIHEANSKSLEHHIARTDALEEKLEKEAEKFEKDMQQALLPIKAFKFIVALAAGISTLIVLYNLIGK